MLASLPSSLLGWQDVAAWLAERPLPWPHLAEPGWLLALLAPLGLWAVSRWQQRRIAHYADPALRPWAELPLHGTSARRRGWIALALSLFWLAAVLALADPRVPKSAASASQLRPPVLFLLDTTAAMQVADVAPDRLARTQTLVAQLVQALPDRRLGLMVARDQAGLILPPATDRALLDGYLADWPNLPRPLVPQNAAAALDWVAQLPAMRGGAIVWLTAADAADFTGDRGTALLAAAEALHHAHIRLIALTVAGSGGELRDHGLPIKSPDDRPLTSTPAPARVAELATLTGGAARVTDRVPDDVRFITRAIAQLPDLTPHTPPANDTRPLFALPLSLALLALLIALGLMLRPKPHPAAGRTLSLALSTLMLTAALATLGLGVTPTPAQADSLWRNDSENAARIAAGQTALAHGDFARAQVNFAAAQGFAARLGTGLAAFRRADYPYAIGQLQQALWLAHSAAERAEARYNLGLALTLAGRLPAARDAFAAVADTQNLPENLHTAARDNLGIVEKLLRNSVKNGANSPKFQGMQTATYGYFQDPAQSQFDKTIQKSEAAVTGSTGSTPPPPTPPTPFVLNPATEASARAKLNLMNDRPAPLLDSLLRQQPYHPPVVPNSNVGTP